MLTAVHDHVDQDWALSGVIFLDGASDRQCALAFGSPLPPSSSAIASHDAETNEGTGSVRRLAAPEPGTILVFPSWLAHWVPPLCAPLKRQRLSVAFNAAALLPGRVWPDGSLAQPLQGMHTILEKAQRRAEEGAAADVRRLWPLQVTSARLALADHPISPAEGFEASAAEETQLPAALLPECGEPLRARSIERSCCVGMDETNVLPRDCAPCSGPVGSGSGGGGSGGGGSGGGGSGGGGMTTLLDPAPSPLLQPIGELARAHTLALLQRNDSVTHAGRVAFLRVLEVSACLLPRGAVDIPAAQSGAAVVATGLVFPTQARSAWRGARRGGAVETPCAGALAGAAAARSQRRRLLIPDVRIAAGDLASHLSLREGAAEREGSLPAPDGSLVAFPSWARAFIDDRPTEGEVEVETASECDAQVSPLAVLFHVVGRGRV